MRGHIYTQRDSLVASSQSAVVSTMYICAILPPYPLSSGAAKIVEIQMKDIIHQPLKGREQDAIVLVCCVVVLDGKMLWR